LAIYWPLICGPKAKPRLPLKVIGALSTNMFFTPTDALVHTMSGVSGIGIEKLEKPTSTSFTVGPLPQEPTSLTSPSGAWPNELDLAGESLQDRVGA
jgi:hypothetical protein